MEINCWFTWAKHGCIIKIFDQCFKIVNYDGISKNATAVGFHEDGKWMYTGGEDCSARIWDLRSRNLQCQRVYQVKAPVNCVILHPNQVYSTVISFSNS